MKNRLKALLAKPTISVKDAMRQMSKAGDKVLFVVNHKKQLLGTLTDGDIRRWVLKGGGLTDEIKNIYNSRPIFVEKSYKIEEIKELMLKDRIEGLPVVDAERKVCDVLLWGQVFENGVIPHRGNLNIPVIIMAGGKGTRLDPFTKVLPKPLIPIGEKTIIELIMGRFSAFGVNEFYLSIHHKSRMIKAYFEEVNAPFKIRYIEENIPLGTVGGLKSIEGKIRGDLMVSNCDILIEADYSEILSFHRKKKYDMTIVGSFRHFTIPYGVCTIENGGELLNIKEKPEYDFLVNTGMYILKKKVLSLIPKNQFFNMTNLIAAVKAKGGKIGVFPIDEKLWIDVGQLEEYQRMVGGLERV